MKILLIQASSRSDGHTHEMVQRLRAAIPFDLIDLRQKQIAPYDYQQDYPEGDDFMPLLRKMVDYDLIIFATPVYWYSMSGLLKNFLDRISQGIRQDKASVRQLKDKKIAVLTCGSERTEVEGFNVPFQLTAGYLDMQYVGAVYTWMADRTKLLPEVEDRIIQFAERLSALTI